MHFQQALWNGSNFDLLERRSRLAIHNRDAIRSGVCGVGMFPVRAKRQPVRRIAHRHSGHIPGRLARNVINHQAISNKAAHPEFTIPRAQFQAVRVHVGELGTLLWWRKGLLHPANLFAARQVGPRKTVKPFERHKEPSLIARDAQRAHGPVEAHRLLQYVIMSEVELPYETVADGRHVHVTSAWGTIAVVRPAANVQSLRHLLLPNVDDVGRSLIVDGDVHPMAVGSGCELIWHTRRGNTRHNLVRRSIQKYDGLRRFNRAVESALVW